MKPWRLTIETGTTQEQNEPVQLAPSLNKGASWTLLTDARTKMVGAMAKSDPDAVRDINNWIGGLVAATSAFTGESAEEIQGRLLREIPTPAHLPPAVIHTERVRANPTAGVSRVVDPSEYDQEDLDQLVELTTGELSDIGIEPPD